MVICKLHMDTNIEPMSQIKMKYEKWDSFSAEKKMDKNHINSIAQRMQTILLGKCSNSNLTFVRKTFNSTVVESGGSAWSRHLNGPFDQVSDRICQRFRTAWIENLKSFPKLKFRIVSYAHWQNAQLRKEMSFFTDVQVYRDGSCSAIIRYRTS